MAAQKYIDDLINSLNYQGAHEFYFPRDKILRTERCLRLGREIGYGLKSFPDKEVKNLLSSLYGLIIVRNSFDSIGVCITNKEFIAEIKSQFI